MASNTKPIRKYLTLPMIRSGEKPTGSFKYYLCISLFTKGHRHIQTRYPEPSGQSLFPHSRLQVRSVPSEQRPGLLNDNQSVLDRVVSACPGYSIFSPNQGGIATHKPNDRRCRRIALELDLPWVELLSFNGSMPLRLSPKCCVGRGIA